MFVGWCSSEQSWRRHNIKVKTNSFPSYSYSSSFPLFLSYISCFFFASIFSFSIFCPLISLLVLCLSLLPMLWPAQLRLLELKGPHVSTLRTATQFHYTIKWTVSTITFRIFYHGIFYLITWKLKYQICLNIRQSFSFTKYCFLETRGSDWYF
jgi:predicted membrane metal-binding protein